MLTASSEVLCRSFHAKPLVWKMFGDKLFDHTGVIPEDAAMPGSLCGTSIAVRQTAILRATRGFASTLRF